MDLSISERNLGVTFGFLGGIDTVVGNLFLVNVRSVISEDGVDGIKWALVLELGLDFHHDAHDASGLGEGVFSGSVSCVNGDKRDEAKSNDFHYWNYI